MRDHDRGLAFDLNTLSRRGALALLGGAGLATLVGCSADNPAPTTAAATSTAATACTTEIPEETAGPFPADGTNGPTVLTESGIVRGDIRGGFGSATRVATGVPLTIELTVLDAAGGCVPLAGAAVYLWHCDQDGKYSLYAEGLTGENYLRGVQAADAAGTVRFTSVFPAAYSGRWPHIHFEVYPSLAEATSAGTPSATSQLALPREVCEAVYATSGYEQSVRNLAGSSLDSDNVFADGHDSQLAAVTGDTAGGYTATLTITV